MFCDICGDYKRPHSTGVCEHCRRSGRNGEKIVGGAVVGGLLGGPLGLVAGGILGGLLGERNEED